MSRRITVVSTDAGPGHNCGLVLGLKKYGDVTTVWQNMNAHGLDFLVPDAKYGYQHIPRVGDDLIIVGSLTYLRLEKYLSNLRYGKIHVIITDGKFPRDPDYFNSRFTEYDVLTTGCKYHFRGGLPTKTYYQPLELYMFDQRKWNRLLVGHSPFGVMKFREKGTWQIIDDTKGYDFDLITGVTWAECLKRKAKCHIFVDQISHYDRDKFKFNDPDYVWPALGKSGVEAMHLGCLTITYGKGYDTDIPAPPVAWCKDNFIEVLSHYKKYKKERIKLAREQKAWALKYASYDFQAQNVLR